MEPESRRPGRIIPKRLRGPYSRSRCSDRAPDLLVEGIRQFNRREFFDQHETLEDLWREEPDDVRYLYQGILQVGVGFYHLGRGNYHGAVSKLRAGIEKLEWFSPRCQGVQLDRFVNSVQRCLGALESLGRERIDEFDAESIPTIELDPQRAK